MKNSLEELPSYITELKKLDDDNLIFQVVSSVLYDQKWVDSKSGYQLPEPETTRTDQQKIAYCVALLEGREVFEININNRKTAELVVEILKQSSSIGNIEIQFYSDHNPALKENLLEAELEENLLVAQCIADFLKDNTTVTKAGIVITRFIDQLLKPFTEVLENNSTLTEFRLGYPEHYGLYFSDNSSPLSVEFIRAIMKNPESKLTAHGLSFITEDDTKAIRLACHLPGYLHWNQAKQLVLGHTTKEHPLSKLPADVLGIVADDYYSSSFPEIQDDQDPNQYIIECYKNLFGGHHGLSSLMLKKPSKPWEQELILLEELSVEYMHSLHTAIVESGDESKEVTNFVAKQKELQGITSKPEDDKQEKSSPNPNSSPSPREGNSVTTPKEKELEGIK